MNKYKDNLLKYSSSLDAVASCNGYLTKMAFAITEHNDSNAAKDFCKLLSAIASKNKQRPQVLEISRTVKNSLIEYYGYNKLVEIYGAHENIDCEEMNNKTLPELLEELNQLIGLSQVKNKIKDLIDYQKVYQLRTSHRLYSKKNTLHLAFMGNPGTGKTTVARIIGRIYKHLGLLSKGQFVEASRTDLIAGYQGQTALKVKKVIERSKGGVLFIDEAYSITENEHSDSYGRECLTELTKALEDFRDDLVVIVAGYTEPMKTFFDSNPGLKSRFNTFIEFNDYSENELEDIFLSMCKDNDYEIVDDAIPIIRQCFKDLMSDKDNQFSNGRFVRNLFDDVVMNHARRVAVLESPTLEDLKLIRATDLVLL